MGNFEEAQVYLQRAFEGRMKIFGDNHPRTVRFDRTRHAGLQGIPTVH
eukprot:SAG11_NODE_14067_length_626_cov_1.438330_2_plen_48_part_00